MGGLRLGHACVMRWCHDIGATSVSFGSSSEIPFTGAGGATKHLALPLRKGAARDGAHLLPPCPVLLCTGGGGMAQGSWSCLGGRRLVQVCQLWRGARCLGAL